MRRSYRSMFVVLAASFVAANVGSAQGGGSMEQSGKVEGGGILVKGWMGKVDPSEATAGLKIENSKFTQEGVAFHVITGPASVYWNSANTASGDYTIKATFNEPKYMNLMSHPHPYGIVIGGNDMGTDQQTYLYCAAYGNGSFIVRGFGPAPFQLNGRHGEPNDAVHKAAGQNQPVTQEVAVSVKGDKVSCAINGTVVGSYNKADVVGAGKLKSTDGVYGIRSAHNTEVLVTGLSKSK